MKLRILICAFCLLLFLPQSIFAFTGLVLPFYDESPREMADFERLLKNREFEKASLELAFHIVLNSTDPGIGRAFTLLGMALYGQGNGEQAAPVFALASKSDNLLADVSALYRIKSLELAQKPDLVILAIDDFNNQFNSSFYNFGDNLDETRADNLDKTGRSLEAGNAFLILAGSNPESSEYSKYRIKAANCFLKAKETAKAKTAVVETLFEAEPGRYTSQALELYFKLYKKAGPKLVMVGYKWYEDRHYRFAAPVLGDALKQMLAVKSDPGEVYELRTKYAYALFSIHDNIESLKQYDILIENISGSDRPHSIFRKAKLLTRMGDNQASKKVFNKLIKEHPQSGYVSAARYQLALINMEDNNYDKAYNYFKWRITKPGGNQEYLIWLAAWCAYRKGYLDSSGTYLDTLIKKYTRSSERDRYRYWRARIHSTKKENKEAVAIFKSINSASPLTYYGMKSYDELARRKIWGRSVKGVLKGNEGRPEIPPLSSKEISTADKVLFNKACAMTDAGMLPEASEAIRLLAPNYVDNKVVIYGLARMYQQTGSFNQAMKLARNSSLYSYCKSKSYSIGPCYFTFAYPRGFDDLVESYANKRNLSLSVVYSLIHQESTYRPWVVSPAHAVGLMQIIPKTGLEIANDLKVENYSDELLYDPETNVRFGTHYMAKVFKRFNNKLPCALASYNAGPDVVGKWMRNKGDLPDEIFIEEIPYRETNNYVKKIIINIAIYRALYDLK